MADTPRFKVTVEFTVDSQLSGTLLSGPTSSDPLGYTKVGHLLESILNQASGPIVASLGDGQTLTLWLLGARFAQIRPDWQGHARSTSVPATISPEHSVVPFPSGPKLVS